MHGKGRELADMMERRKVDILCVQETRWKGSKARSSGAGFKLFYYGVDSKRNGVGVVLKEEFVRNVLEVKRVSDRVMSLKLEFEGVMLNVVSGYAPQVGCELEEKERFWSELDEVMESIPTGERVVIGADFNGHVGEGNTGDEEVMGKFGVKERNLEGQMVVDFAKRMDMGVVNTYFQKREEHRVTYKSGGRRTQVDYILCRRSNLKEISDCKVVVGESVARQHRMVVCRMTLMVCKTKRSKIEKKTKWWKLKKEECCEEFRQKLRQALGGQVLLPDDWETTAEVIRETGRKVLGVSSGRRKEDKETWWWNEEVQDSIQRKRLAKKKWDMDRTEENRQEYKELQRRVKREVSKAKQKAYEELYTRLDTREGERDLYRLARQRDRDGKDVQQVRVIKDRDGRVLTSEESVQRRWKEYFEELMNEENEREKRVEGVNSVEQKVDKIRKDEVRRALKRMKSGKAVGPDDIPVEVWKCLGEPAVEFLANLMNRVLESERMPEEWRRSVLVPIFKNKGDVQSCSNYRGIKLMSHTMKLWERVVEARLRKVVEICEQQYGFMPRKSTTDAIFALRILMEKYRDGQKELHCVFVDLEKAYDRVPREELWYCMKKSGVAEKYVRVVQDMYERSRTVVRCAVGQTEEFNVEVGLHQGSALSPFLFAIVMDQLSEEVRQESPWTMMFADDIVICSESREQVEENLERWRFALERRGMKVSRSKTEYMCVNEREGSGTVRLQGEEVKKVQEFKYLGSTVQSNGECGKEVKKRVQAAWNGWRKVSGVLCDQKISARIKGKVYRTVVRPAMLYGLETVSLRKRQESELEVAELKMLRFVVKSVNVCLEDDESMFHLLLLLGFCTTGVCLSRQYHFINQNKTWAEAQRYCRENYVDLASIDNAEEELALIKTVDIRNYSPVWLGLYDDLNSWKWSLDHDDAFYQEGKTSFRNWYIHKPGNWYETRLCAVFLGFNGVWQEKHCSEVLPLICFDASASSRVYYFVNENKTWTEAQRYCRENYTDLATIDNMEEMKKLLNAANTSYSGLAWIGLYDDPDSWRWSLDDDSLYNEGEKTFTGWYHEPDNYDGKELCVFIRSDGKWSDGNCNSYMNFVCYDGRNVTDGYIWVTQFMPWAEAQHYCRQHYTDLASVRNQEDNKKILNLTGGSAAWIGLYRTRLWSDQHKSTYENWRQASPYIPEQPDNGLYVFWEHGNQHCTAVSLGDYGQWTDEDCLATFPFICYNSFDAIWWGASCYTMMPFICFDAMPSISHHYHFVNENKTWTEAQKYCREIYRDLATIDNMEEMNNLLNTANVSYTGLAWIGLYDILDDWRWSLDDDAFYKEDEREFRGWYHEPNNYNGKELCVSMYYTGEWFDQQCTQRLGFVCYNASTPAMSSASSRAYYFVNENKTWTEAQRYCRENYTDLATIDNMEEMKKLLNAANTSYSGLAWIGLYDDPDSWRWSLDDDSLYNVGEKTFTGWYHEPDNYNGKELCVFIRSDGKWSDGNCNSYMNFVCYDGRNVTDGYIWVTQFMPWAEAQHYCRQHYTDLASVRNQEDNKKILNLTGGSAAWIGLYRTRLWSDQHKSTYENWRQASPYIPEQPDNGLYVFWEHGNQHCTAVSLGDYGKWTDEDCLATFPFICYNRRRNASESYIFVQQYMSWTEAQRYCRENYTDLISVKNKDENLRIRSLLRHYFSNVWIGLYRTSYWSDRNNSSFSYWNHGQPDNYGQSEHCTAVFTNSGTWTDENCGKTFPFFCYRTTSLSSRQYHFINVNKTWTEAQRYCRENYTDLATIENIEEVYTLIYSVNGSYSGLAWIGLYGDLGSWRWSLDDDAFYKEGERDFRGWYQEPNNYNGKELCVSMRSTGEWFDQQCTQLLGFICYSGTNREYVWISTRMTWQEAQSFCRVNYTDLASVRNETELQRILSIIYSGYDVWIGLYRSRSWSDQSNSTFTYWRPENQEYYISEPDNGLYIFGQSGSQRCTSVDSTGKWTDENCFARYPFLCYSATTRIDQTGDVKGVATANHLSPPIPIFCILNPCTH
ncbi:hypothetical protein QTP86_002411 [Hemibagrus guttatus]|nr:hypothetical protein QTP86_002411 [Hemibagrus guttatus]